MKTNDLFTVNGRKCSYGQSDRSYSSHIWRVVEEDESHIWAIAEFGDFWTTGNIGKGRPVAFLKRDYDFLPCNETVLANLRRSDKEAIKKHFSDKASPTPPAGEE